MKINRDVIEGMLWDSSIEQVNVLQVDMIYRKIYGRNYCWIDTHMRYWNWLISCENVKILIFRDNMRETQII